jgi:hypothetical protein
VAVEAVGIPDHTLPFQCSTLPSLPAAQTSLALLAQDPRSALPCGSGLSQQNWPLLHTGTATHWSTTASQTWPEGQPLWRQLWTELAPLWMYGAQS